MRRQLIIFLVRKTWVPFLLFAFVLLVGGVWYTFSALSKPSLQGKLIIIDAGHGGQDPGAQVGGVREKDINLDIALRLRETLSAKGCKVIMTREVDKDFYLPNFVLGRAAKRAELNQRIEIARSNEADFLISIHTNSFPAGNSYGMETYYDIESTAGKALADLIQTELKLLQSDNKRNSKSGDYYLLHQMHLTQIPSVLVEVGFLSNAKERKLLKTTTYQEQIAKAITTGIENYLNQYPQGIQDPLAEASAHPSPESDLLP